MDLVSTEVALWLVVFLLGALCGIQLSRKNKDENDPRSKQTKEQWTTFNDSRAASYPPAYPNGWYKVIDATNVGKKEIKYVSLVGLDLIVWRGEDGGITVMDSYCPHMGANLASGTVIGNCIECPFHRWRFDADGKCAHIPYTTSIPAAAKTKTYPAVEQYNMVLMYFDAEGRDPPYYPPEIEGITDKAMVYRGAVDKVIHMHIQEFAENSADYQHFNPLHGVLRLPWTDVVVPGFTIRHQASWKIDDERPYIATFHDLSNLQFRGKDLHDPVPAIITFIGPAGIVYFRFSLPQMGDIILFHTHSPIGPTTQRVEFRYYSDPSVPKWMAWYVIGNWISQWKQDIIIWENKKHIAKPVLARGDGPVMQLRGWYKQFYSEHSAEASTKKHECPTNTCSHGEQPTANNNSLEW
jgi:cholesterol 7-dehydrogenase